MDVGAGANSTAEAAGYRSVADDAVRELVLRSIPALAALGPSPWRDVLRGAVMTADDQIPDDRRAILEVLTS